jgi:hypothetical protein
MCTSESERKEPGMQVLSYRDGSCGHIRREPRVPDRVWVVVGLSERAGVVPKGGRLRERGMTNQITSNRETRIIGGHCRYHAGYELLSWLKWSLRREPRVPVRVRVDVGLSKRAGVVPEGGRLRERRMTY